LSSVETFALGQIYATGFKAAGVGAQQTASAAAAFLLQDSESAWSHIDLCWVGSFHLVFDMTFFPLTKQIF